MNKYCHREDNIMQILSSAESLLPAMVSVHPEGVKAG
jgi:hypothetical protein